MDKKIHILTFAGDYGDSTTYISAAQNLQRLVTNTEYNIFTSFNIVTPSLLKQDTEFWTKHGDFIEKNKRGYGYWIWKAYLLFKYLNVIQDGDVLIYLDACTYFNKNGIPRLLEYIEILKKNPDGNLFFQFNDPVYEWCKMDTLISLNCQEFVAAKQVVSTVILTSKNQKNIEFFYLMYELSCNYHLIDDSPSILPNLKEFNEHRHDQTLFSLLARKILPASISIYPDYWDLAASLDDPRRPYLPFWIKANGHPGNTPKPETSEI